MPGGRAGKCSEAQPISCHIDEAILTGLLLRGEVVVELVSITQFGILDEDALDKVIPLVVLLPLFPLPTTLFGTVTNWAVARLPSAVFIWIVDPPSNIELLGTEPGIR